MTTVHVIVPDAIDDPARPSGGNVYDRRVCRELGARGWDVREHAVAGAWPQPDVDAQNALARAVARVPDDGLVLIDGLIASAVPSVLVAAARRLRLVVLVHLPLGDSPPGHEIVEAGAREGAVLSAAAAIVTTSGWARDRLLAQYQLPAKRIHVAEPGVDLAELAPGTSAGGALLCVAPITPHKGHDVLLTALASLADQSWHCMCVGSLERDPQFVQRLRRQAETDGIDARIWFTGARSADALDVAYSAADVLVLASQAETYGMVVTEALARGLPVVATAVGGLPSALGQTSDGRVPGLLVPPDDPTALSAALARWFGDAELRDGLRDAARERRQSLPCWATTTDQVARALTSAAA